MAVENKLISHCKNGQGGRAFSKMKHREKGGSERLKLRAKNQPIPQGKERFPFGKYYDWYNDPDDKKPAFIALQKAGKI